MRTDALVKLAESANSRDDFVRFLKALSSDFEKSGSEWGNNNLHDFLDGLFAWAEGCPQYYRNMKLPVDADRPQWRVFADMLLAARVYE